MLDIRLLRQDIDDVARLLKKKHFDLDVEGFRKLEAERKAADMDTQNLQGERNKASRRIGELVRTGKPVEEAKAEVAAILQKIDQDLEECLERSRQANSAIEAFLLAIPNTPETAVPEGKDEKDNREILRWDAPKPFDHVVKDHVDLGAGLKGLDFDMAVKITGSRFVVMRGGVARMHRALVQFMLDTHTGKHGYEEVNVPFIVNADSLRVLASCRSSSRISFASIMRAALST
jgi:seryl-tRNA synthetase